MAKSDWQPPAELSLEEIVRRSDEVAALADRPCSVGEDIFSVKALGLTWDLGLKVYAPEGEVARGADGRPVGVLMIHGGFGDFRRFDTFAPALAGKLGYKVVCFTFPGRLYFEDPSRDWPGDTIYEDGTVRTPIWQRGEQIGRDQYELVKVVPELAKRRKRGTLFFASAREGTDFYARMAAWPAAFEAGLKEACRRQFGEGTYSIYVHGHSTGGPFAHMISQRVEDIVGILGMETSPFGAIYQQMVGEVMDYPFTYLAMRTWRDYARYMGPEAGPDAANKLPMLMEEVFEAWDREKTYPQFKAEYMVHFANLGALEKAARASAKRAGMDRQQTEELIQRYFGYARPLEGPGVKPVPPILYGITRSSVDHKLERYTGVVLPQLAKIRPAPKAHLVYYAGGGHSFMKPTDRLPYGIGGATAHVWKEAIEQGYYL